MQFANSIKPKMSSQLFDGPEIRHPRLHDNACADAASPSDESTVESRFRDVQTMTRTNQTPARSSRVHTITMEPINTLQNMFMYNARPNCTAVSCTMQPGWACGASRRRTGGERAANRWRAGSERAASAASGRRVQASRAVGEGGGEGDGCAVSLRCRGRRRGWRRLGSWRRGRRRRGRRWSGRRRRE